MTQFQFFGSHNFSNECRKVGSEWGMEAIKWLVFLVSDWKTTHQNGEMVTLVQNPVQGLLQTTIIWQCFHESVKRNLLSQSFLQYFRESFSQFYMFAFIRKGRFTNENLFDMANVWGFRIATRFRILGWWDCTNKNYNNPHFLLQNFPFEVINWSLEATIHVVRCVVFQPVEVCAEETRAKVRRPSWLFAAWSFP